MPAFSFSHYSYPNLAQHDFSVCFPFILHHQAWHPATLNAGKGQGSIDRDTLRTVTFEPESLCFIKCSISNWYNMQGRVWGMVRGTCGEVKVTYLSYWVKIIEINLWQDKHDFFFFLRGFTGQRMRLVKMTVKMVLFLRSQF